MSAETPVIRINIIRFLRNLINKLTSDDFATNEYLTEIYDNYLMVKKNKPKLEMFIHFIYYITNDKLKSEASSSLLYGIYLNIMSAYPIDALDKKTDDIGEDLLIKLLANDKIDFTAPEHKKRVLFTLTEVAQNRKKGIIINDENDIINSEIEDKEMNQLHDGMTANLINEIRADNRGDEINTIVKDVLFKQVNKMLGVWQSTEDYCQNLLNVKTGMDKILGSYALINAENINIDNGEPMNLLTFHKKQEMFIDEDIPQSEFIPKKFTPKWSAKRFNMVVDILQEYPVKVATQNTKKQTNSLLMVSASPLIMGGGVDQGLITNESILYYVSTCSIPANNIIMAYPLKYNQIAIYPKVIVCKKCDDFTSLPIQEHEKIVVASAPAWNRPPTTLKNQEKYKFDEHLCDFNVEYTEPFKVINHLRHMFKCALFFGYTDLVLDDGGIKDFWLPAYHHAKLVFQVLKEYRNRFNTVKIAIPDKTIFNIYNQMRQHLN